MRKLVILTLLIALTARLSYWKMHQNLSEDLCSRLLSRTSGRRVLPSKFIGSVGRGPNGRWVLHAPRLVLGEGKGPFFGEITLGEDVVANAPLFGRQISVLGPFRCQILPRNPGRVEDGLLDFAFPHIQARGKRFRLQLLERPADWVTRLQSGFYYWLKRRFEKYPGLLGWELALWTGSEEKLPEKLSEFFREAGLSHLLAMSGQRVFGLSIILSLLLSVGLRFGADRVFRHGSRLLPVSCSLLLFLSSGGAPSIRRVLAMAVVLLLIRLRKWHCSSFQTACSSVGCAIAVEPDLLSRPAFLLSVGGCALLVQLVGTGGVRRGFRSYLFIVGLMPLFVLPLNAFFFAKVAWLGFLNCLLVSWLWDFFLIPVGFSLPAVSYCLPAWGMQKLENLWQQLLRFQLWIATGVGGAYRNVVRLTWYEVVLCEGLLLSLVVIFLRRFASARRRN